MGTEGAPQDHRSDDVAGWGGYRAGPGVRVLAVIFGLALALIGLFLLWFVLGDVSLNEISRDPLATVDADPLLGAQSVVGVLIWWSAAAIALFSWAVLRARDGSTKTSSFFLWVAAITAILALDDQFQFHDHMSASVFGLREREVLALFGVILAVFLLRFRRIILRSGPLLLALAVVFALISLAGDFVSQREMLAQGLGEPDQYMNYAEDAFKFLAIVSWTAWIVRFAYHSLLGGSDRET